MYPARFLAKRIREDITTSASGPGPPVAVVADLDDPPVIGAFFGEVNANIHRALGCAGAITNSGIRDMDEVAYVRFASVYKDFRDTDSFLKEIESLVRKSPTAPAGEGPRQTRLFDSQE